MNLTDQQLDRYARHIVLRDVGGRGQKKLLNAKVLIVGAGGLGSPMLLYLAAAGVGTIGIIDDDRVDLSNLQRQIAHETADINQAKVKSAQTSIERLNPDIKVIPYQARLNIENAEEIVSAYDLIADGTDNFDTRFLLNDICFFMHKPLVSGAMLQFEGQISTFKAFKEGNNPCYRCLFPAPPPPEISQTCGEAGVLGALAGVMGSLQAIEIIKEILNIGDSLSGRLLLYDALSTEFRKIKVSRDPACSLCGEEATITSMPGHEGRK
jgi:molybdopterin-synthase adenylyltransferase